jgi:hypothetical protein
MDTNKKSNDISGLDANSSNKLKTATAKTLAGQSGIGNDPKKEPEISFFKTQNEYVIKNPNSDSYITLGKDRPAGKYSGYGGSGDTKCSSIDLVVGRISPVAVEEAENGQLIYSDNNITLDAARIYISQKTDIDENFKLTDGSIGNSKAKSAIGLKADGIRIIAREGIKLVTKTDYANAAGAEINENNGIEIIALNDTENLQPMLLGQNTVDCLTELIDEVDRLQNRVEYFIEQQQKYNDSISQHTHNSPFFGIVTLPSPNLIIDNMSLTLNKVINVTVPYYFQKINFNGIKTKYLSNGDKAIKSKYNKVN